MRRAIRVIVNGCAIESSAEPRTSLADFLRDDLDLTGTHVGCEHGVCGACTVLLDGEPVRGCLLLAVQAEGRRITTIEGMAEAAGSAAAENGLHPLQQAFRDKHGLQCGFCTPGIVLTAWALLRDHPAPRRDEVREALSGHLCRCTGYQFIVDAIVEAAARMNASAPGGDGTGASLSPGERP